MSTDTDPEMRIQSILAAMGQTQPDAGQLEELEALLHESLQADCDAGQCLAPCLGCGAVMAPAAAVIVVTHGGGREAYCASCADSVADVLLRVQRDG